jgi:hypothetical protein
MLVGVVTYFFQCEAVSLVCRPQPACCLALSYQPSTSNAATAADSPVQLHVEMQSADTEMDVDEPKGPFWVHPGTFTQELLGNAAAEMWIIFMRANLKLLYQ